MNLTKVVEPRKHTAYSINLERDSFNPEVIKSYQITQKTREILLRFVDALEGEKVSAWEIIGPYGMGKSSFLNYLITLLASTSNMTTKIALEKLKLIDTSLYLRLVNAKNKYAGENGFLSISITANFEPINKTLIRGLHNMILQNYSNEYSEILSVAERIIANGIVESSELINCFQKLKKADNRPIIIVIDEFGKNLEYLGYYHKQGDLYILQQLAEMNYVYLWVSLHRSFNDYLVGLPTIQQQEWSKIQGRFEEIPFIESTIQMLQFIKKLLKPITMLKRKEQLDQWASDIHKTIKGLPVIEDGIFKEAEDISSIYPLHPFTAIALIEVVRRFAQNERTLVSFLCSGNNYALPAQLCKLKLDRDDGLYAIGFECLYDYFFQLSHTTLSNRPESQRWIEIQSIIEASGHFPKEEKSLLKTIGVLNLLTESLGLTANDEVITILMEATYGIRSQKVKEKLHDLIQRGVVVYRDYANEYRLWEGSCIDIREIVSLEKQKLEVLPLETLVNKHLVLAPKIAARHSYRSGTVRRFECRLADISSLEKGLNPNEGYDGLVVYCFGNDEIVPQLPNKCEDKRPLIFAYAPIKNTLKEFAVEEIACRRMLESNSQVAHDKVAQKELDFRLRSAQNRLKEYLERIYKPGSADVIWYADGKKIEIRNSKELSTLLSDLCDECFKNSPIIRNEIINADKLSSVAARARRELIEAMATKEREEKLGLQGCGPEVALYRSILLDAGLHIKDEGKGSWLFSIKGKDSSLKPIWDRIDKLVDEVGMQGISVANILDILKEPPFGMRQGPTLIYISLYILANVDSIAVFREDNYQPYLSAADMALLLKRPDLFTIKKFKATREEEQVFAVYQNLLKNIQLSEEQDLRNISMIGVVGPLVKFISKLTTYAKKTREVSVEAQQIRTIIMNTTDPIRFLFQELPEGLGLDIKNQKTDPEYWKKELLTRLQSALYELGQAFPKLNGRIQSLMLKVFQCESFEQLYNSQQELTKSLVDICDDPDLKAVLRAMSRTNSDPLKWMQGVAGIMVKKPVDTWSDQDFSIFAAKLYDYADRIEQLQVIWSRAFGISKKNAKLISVIDSKGRIKRSVVDLTLSDQEIEEIDMILNQVLSLQKDKVKILMAHLADKIL